MSTLLNVFVVLTMITVVTCKKSNTTHEFADLMRWFTKKIVDRYSYTLKHHFVISPVSLWTILSSIGMGTSGTTLEEIRKAKCIYEDHEVNIKYHQHIRNSLNRNPFGRIGLLAIHEEFPIKRSFLDRTRVLGTIDIMLLNLTNEVTSTALINERVQSSTMGAIENIVSEEYVKEKQIIALDAIHLAGYFRFGLTELKDKVPFYNEQGGVIGQITPLYIETRLRITTIRSFRADFLKLPFASNNHALILILPEKGQSINNIYYELFETEIEDILDQLNHRKPHIVHLTLPKFEMSCELVELNTFLREDLEIRDIFQEDADFSELTEEVDGFWKLFVTDVVQRVGISVDGFKTEVKNLAVSRAKADLVSKQIPRIFNATKPFVFMVVDKTTELMVFLGVYSLP